jgi:hypothetical protein
MANRSQSKETRPVFRSLEDIRKHFQPDQSEKDLAASKPFAALERVLTPEQFQRIRSELASRK